ncbi:hypothetical protein [Jeongeupia naejangsanensis]|uniref:O-antigen ligase domain-containing protein n=1 Tax=Jeongeupia naejangsanensis TaxID=613195 RepID=A0ABS2BHQ6_9NEIS|nr:hypothetical protein [Jeongeupia naejangsanensis]MBM3115143.1 hypothetical protein [Jeongeupia naejangsanensis]
MPSILNWSPAQLQRAAVWTTASAAIGGLALLLGGAIAIGFYAVPALLVALLLGGVFLQLPDRYALLMLMVVVLFVQGAVGYYTGFTKISWLAYGLAGLFAVKFVTKLFDSRPQTGAGFAGWMWALLAFASIAGIGLLINRPALAQLIAGLKNQFPFWMVALYLPLAGLNDADWRAIWRLMLIVLVCQVPFVFHQHFFIAAGRSVMGWDAVVGTFGGNPEAGGLNAVMVLFCIISFALALNLYLRQQLSGRHFSALLVCLLLVILLGEVKAAFFWLPVAILLVFGRAILRSPVKLLLASAGIAVFVLGVGFVYEKLYWKDVPQRGLAENAEHSFDYFFDPNLIVRETGEVSRGAALALWAKDPQHDIYSVLLGRGIAASMEGAISRGEVAQRYYPYHIGATALAILLWDYGVLGTLAYLSILLLALVSLFRQLRPGQADPVRHAYLSTALIALVLVVLTIPYNSTLMNEPATQLLVALACGYAAWGSKRKQNDA